MRLSDSVARLYHLGLQLATAPLLAVQKARTQISGRQSAQLRVMLCHNISVTQVNHFRKQIERLQESWKFVDAKTFGKMVSGEQNICGNNVLLSFDDGFLSNRIVSEHVLKDLDVKAIFFVIPKFLDCGTIAECSEYIQTQIYPGWAAHLIPSGLRNMSWEDIEYLKNEGHEIGSHTLTHKKLSPDISNRDLSREIAESGNEIERRLGCAVEHFAFSFGNPSSFSAKAMKIAADRYKYVYSGIRGNNAVSLNPLAIRRATVSEFDSPLLAEGFISGIADWQHFRRRNIIDSWSTRDRL